MCRVTVTLAGIILASIVLVATAGSAADKKLSIVSTSGTNQIHAIKGTSFDVLVKVDNVDPLAVVAYDIAGASFTIIYNTMDFGLNVESTFFRTFLQQSIPTPSDQGYVTVDYEDYSTPIVHNDIASGTMIAAARVDNGLGSDSTLFTLRFATSAYAPVGSSSIITIVPSSISNTDAGYIADGEAIPLLVGIGSDNSYPVHSVSTIIPFTVVIKALDYDEDGIDDDWEILHFGNLPKATATSDFDKDGYTDLQEYLNDLAGETDLDDKVYDPKTKNTAGGTGYITNRLAYPAINMLLLND